MQSIVTVAQLKLFLNASNFFHFFDQQISDTIIRENIQTLSYFAGVTAKDTRYKLEFE